MEIMTTSRGRREPLQDRYQGLITLVYQLGGRMLYSKLGGDRYAVRLEWNSHP
jgi:hypothetical protein